MTRIFLSHSSQNNAEAIAIRDWMKAQGWDDVFLDLDPERGLTGGDHWQISLNAAVVRCELIVVLISPDWAASSWCKTEFLLAKLAQQSHPAGDCRADAPLGVANRNAGRLPRGRSGRRVVLCGFQRHTARRVQGFPGSVF